jgi:hypothetical protein
MLPQILQIGVKVFHENFREEMFNFFCRKKFQAGNLNHQWNQVFFREKPESRSSCGI